MHLDFPQMPEIFFLYRNIFAMRIQLYRTRCHFNVFFMTISLTSVIDGAHLKVKLDTEMIDKVNNEIIGLLPEAK